MSEKDELLAEYEKYAQTQGFHLNPDKKIIDWIADALLQKEKTMGEKYCPCRKITGNKEEDKKIICPCIYHLDEIRNDGHCHCNLFVK